MKTDATLAMTDLNTQDEAVVIVRHDDSTVALCLSLMSDGELEVLITKENARKLVAALQAAVE